jgi:hypothetical protein
MPEQRQRTRAQERAEDIDIRPTKLLEDIEALRGELAEAKAQGDEYLTALQRERAEFLNYKRRTAEERERDLGLAGEDLIRKVLTLADDFDRAIDARPETPVPEHPSTRVSTTPSPPSPAQAARRARSSSRSGAAIASETASCDRPSSPSPARPNQHPRTTDLTDRIRARSTHEHGQDHRHRPRHDELRRGRHGRRRADRHRVG